MIWTIEDDPSPADAGVISAGVLRFGRAAAADGNAHPIACFLRDDGEVIAGATGRTEYRRLFVNYLWVRDDLRGQGIGRDVLARIEQAASARGALDAQIETLDDRNAALYRHLGYVPLATIGNAVGPFTRHILQKSLTPGRPDTTGPE